jgi:hypothetical protein
MSAITPHYRSVQQLLQSQSFSIDEYQREYKWEKENVDELLSDLQAKFFSHYKLGDETPDKRTHYAKQNFYAASLDASAYQHQPKFQQFSTFHQLPFKAFHNFTKEEQLARRQLVAALVELVWAPQHLQEAAV